MVKSYEQFNESIRESGNTLRKRLASGKTVDPAGIVDVEAFIQSENGQKFLNGPPPDCVPTNAREWHEFAKQLADLYEAYKNPSKPLEVFYYKRGILEVVDHLNNTFSFSRHAGAKGVKGKLFVIFNAGGINVYDIKEMVRYIKRGSRLHCLFLDVPSIK